MSSIHRGDAGTTSARRGRRSVLDGMRRKVERALLIEDRAEALASAAEAVLGAAEGKAITAEMIEISALRAAVARYREVLTLQ